MLTRYCQGVPRTARLPAPPLPAQRNPSKQSPAFLSLDLGFSLDRGKALAWEAPSVVVFGKARVFLARRLPPITRKHRAPPAPPFPLRSRLCMEPLLPHPRLPRRSSILSLHLTPTLPLPVPAGPGRRPGCGSQAAALPTWAAPGPHRPPAAFCISVTGTTTGPLPDFRDPGGGWPPSGLAALGQALTSGPTCCRVRSHDEKHSCSDSRAAGGGSVQRWSQHQWALPLKRTSRQRASLFMNLKNHSLEARCERNRGCLICSFLTLPGYLLFYPFLFYMLHGEQLQGTSPRMVPLESSMTSPNKGKSVHYIAWSGIILLRLKKKKSVFCLSFVFVFSGAAANRTPLFSFLNFSRSGCHAVRRVRGGCAPSDGVGGVFSHMKAAGTVK